MDLRYVAASHQIILFYFEIKNYLTINMRYQIFFCFPIIILFVQCAQNVENAIEVADEEGHIIEKYQIQLPDSIKNGTYNRYDTEGKLMVSANYVAGKLQGERRIYYPSGKVEVIEHYENDLHHGLYQVFYENGNIKLQGQYVEGKMEGEWQGFYEDATLKEKVTFKENQENGSFTEFHPNGKIKAKGIYLEGDNEDGLLELFDEYGDLERTMQCKKGRCQTTWTRMKT